MFSLANFPPEILLQIADNVSPERSAKSSSLDRKFVYSEHVYGSRTIDLASLSLVSKQMRAIATPFLFELIQPPAFAISPVIFPKALPVNEIHRILAGHEPLIRHAK